MHILLGGVSIRAGVRVVRSVDEKVEELRRRYPGYLRRGD